MTGANRIYQGRVLTIDAVRGLGLLTLVLGSSLLPGLRELPESPLTRILSGQLVHAEWHGFTFFDWGTQTFVMALGMSAVASTRRRHDRGEARADVLVHVLKRSVLLFLLGLFIPLFTGGFPVRLDKFTLLDVLQNLAICIFATYLVHLTLTHWLQALLLVAILLGNWAFMELFPAAGFGGGDYSRGSNFHARIAHRLTWLDRYSSYQLTALPGMLANALMGLWIGELLLMRTHHARKLAILGVSGITLLALAYTVEPSNPFNKRLWTTSYILVSAGWMCLATLVFYSLMDVRGIRAIFYPLVVFGRHSLLTYLSFSVIPFDGCARLILGSMFSPYLGRAHLLVTGSLAALLCWLFVFWIDHRTTKMRAARAAQAGHERQGVETENEGTDREPYRVDPRPNHEFSGRH